MIKKEKIISNFQMSIAQKNNNIQDLNHDINRIVNLESEMNARQVQAQQLMQAQQIANILYGSQQHISSPNHRGQLSQSSYGSTPHISQGHSPQQQHQQQQHHYNNVRPMSRNSHQYLNEQGQYVSNNHQQYSPYMDNENGIYPYEQQMHQVNVIDFEF